MRKYKKLLRSICIAGGIVALMGDVIYCYATGEQANYFYVPFANAIYIVVFVWIGVVVSKAHTKVADKKRMIEKTIQNIIDTIHLEKMAEINSEDKLNRIKLLQRSIDNDFRRLKMFSEEFDYSENLEYSVNNFKNYWDCVSNHITDMEHLRTSRIDFENYLLNSVNKLNDILFCLNQ
jgi:hypothetical protein